VTPLFFSYRSDNVDEVRDGSKVREFEAPFEMMVLDDCPSAVASTNHPTFLAFNVETPHGMALTHLVASLILG